MGTEISERGKKRWATMLKKYNGDEEALRKSLREQGRMGGIITRDSGLLAKVNFTGDPDRARIAGKKGGLAEKTRRSN